MSQILIRNSAVVNEGEIKYKDVLISNGLIERIEDSISPKGNVREIDATGLHLLPGVIDDQVHFR